MDHFCYLCFVFVMLSCLFVVALGSPAGKGHNLLTCLYITFSCVFATFTWVRPSKHACMGPILATHMGPIWGVQRDSAWVPYGLSHMRVAQMGPIWVPYNSLIKKKEMISTYLFKLISLFIRHDKLLQRWIQRGFVWFA